MKGSHSKGILIRLFLFHVIAACYSIGVNKTVKFLGPVLINLIQAPVGIVHKVDLFTSSISIRFGGTMVCLMIIHWIGNPVDGAVLSRL